MLVECIFSADIVTNYKKLKGIIKVCEYRKRVPIDILVDAIKRDYNVLIISRIIVVEKHDLTRT